MPAVTFINVSDLKEADRAAVERLVGQPLRSEQRLVIQVTSIAAPTATSTASTTGQLPSWCNVYEGLSDRQVAELEAAILARSTAPRL